MKRFIWGILIIFFVLFSFSPTLYELSQKEKLVGRTFELVHNYITDYNFYLSRIREGVEGKWTVVELYTSEPHGGSFIQIFYLLLGKFDIHAPNVYLASTGAYHMARIVLGCTILALIALWVRFLFPSFLWQCIAFLVIVTASVWPVVVPVGETLRFGGPMSWWTLMDNLQRITFLPHLLIGQALLLFLLFAGGNDQDLHQPGNWIFLGTLSFILGMVFPPGLVFLGVGFGIVVLFSFFSHWKSFQKKDGWNSWLMAHVFPRTMILLVSIPSLIYFSLMFGIYPWKRLVELDVIHPLPFQFPEYIRALGPTLPLGLVGLILALFKKDAKFVSVSAWVIAWMVCLFIFQFIPQQSPLRFSEMLPHVPLGIFTTYVCYQIWLLSTRKSSNRTKFLRLAKGALKVFSLAVPILLITVGLGVMASSFLWQKDFIDQKVIAGWPAVTMNNYIVYPISGFTDALKFLETSSVKDAVILSDMTAGNYIPPYTGRRAFVGHDNTVHLEKKREEVHQFFRGKTKDAPQWLIKNDIHYIFFGPEEKEEGSRTTLLTSYPFLKEAYRNPDVIIYFFTPSAL